MLKKLLLIFLFLIFFIIISTSISNAFTYTISYEEENGDVIYRILDFGDIDLLNYYYVSALYDSVDGELYSVRVLAFENEPYIGERAGSGLNTSVSVFYHGKCFLYNYRLSSNYVSSFDYSKDISSSIALTEGEYLFSTFDIKDKTGEVIFGDSIKLSLNLTVTPSENTSEVPVLITSDWYYLDTWNTSLNVYTDNGVYDVYLHIPQVENPIGVDDAVSSVEITEDAMGRKMYRYIYKVYKNGTYRFKLVDIDGLVGSEYDEPSDDYVVEKTVVIDNIVSSGDTVDNYNENGVFDPTPFLSYEYVSDSEIYICTQKFFIHELIDLQCYWAKDIDIKNDFNDTSKWTKIDNPRTFKDSISGLDVYQFYFSVKNDNFDADGTYYVKFYNVFLDKWTWSSIDINFDEILKVDGSWLFKYTNFFRERFGFLVYPFDLAVDVLQRINNIEFSEPRIYIPDIYEPSSNTKFISATEYNFNTLLENDIFRNVHNIYLIVVDVIIIFALVVLLKDKIMGVFEK